jgi:hypothetical protein
MANQDQLEIISTDGAIEFYSLDPNKGVTNIGRHPENDIVIEDTGVAPFHVMIDHRQKPYRLVVLSPEGETLLEGELLAPNVTKALQNWDNIRLGQYTLILVEGTAPGTARSAATTPMPPAPRPAAPPPPAAVPFSARSVPVPLPVTRPEPAAGAYPAPAPAPAPTPPRINGGNGTAGYFKTRPPDQEDAIIITRLFENEWQLDVEQPATYQLSITNGGDIVAAFAVSVHGLDADWLEISESYVNLYERETTTVTITVAAPRLPSSRAGAHHFAIIVTSSNYPGQMSQRGATLTLNPYYEYMVEELSPKRQTIGWSTRTGRASFPIINRSNTPVTFKLEGKDEEKGCSFEFDVPGETIPLATQAELRLYPEESITVPIAITPHSRRLIGFRRRTYAYTVTTTLTEVQQTPRSVLGELKAKPLIGPWILLLIALILLALIVWLIRPHLNTFMFIDGGRTAVIRNGTPVTMRWEASFFTSDVNIDPAIEGLEQPLVQEGTVVAYPKTDTTYYLIGENLLSKAIPFFSPPTRVVNVDVVAFSPRVEFQAQPSQVINDGEIVLSWQVEDADKIELFLQSGNNEILLGDFSDQPLGGIRVTPEPGLSSITYILRASNAYALTPTPVPQIVSIVTPSPTIPATPNIILFAANPPVINEGEESTLSWSVTGVEVVTIQGIDNASALPAEYQFAVRPTASTDYFLTVPGMPPRPARVEVIPATATPSPTPPPEAPVIVFFTADPEEVVKGDSTDVTLEWSVDGEYTNIELSSPELASPLSNLLDKGSFSITLSDTALFVLTAFNGEAKSSASVQVKSTDPTPTPSPVPPPPPTPIPPRIIEFVISSPASVIDQGGTNPHKYQVQENTDATFRWNTSNASLVTFSPQGGSSQSVGPVGQTNQTISATGGLIKTYTLTAENDAGQRVTQSIQVTLVDPPPPNAPFSVVGVETVDDNNALEWQWDDQPGKDDIIGFRVYRADLPGGSYTRVADENDLDAGARDWTDEPLNPTCSKGYYVVAVALDVEGNTYESAASTNSWFSTPC